MPDVVALSAFCARLDGTPEGAALSALRVDMDRLIKRLMHLNETNRLLIEKKRQYAGAMLNGILSGVRGGCIYDSTGSSEAIDTAPGFFDRQA